MLIVQNTMVAITNKIRDFNWLDKEHRGSFTAAVAAYDGLQNSVDSITEQHTNDRTRKLNMVNSIPQTLLHYNLLKLHQSCSDDSVSYATLKADMNAAIQLTQPPLIRAVM